MATRISRVLFVRRPALVSRRVFIDSLVRLNPLRLVANPVMLIVEITFFIVAAMAIYPEGFPGVARRTAFEDSRWRYLARRFSSKKDLDGSY